jgi:two-component system OmpR family sensor kinase
VVPSIALFRPWLVLAALSCAAMWLSPGDETIPYHVAWIGLALAYGLEEWPRSQTLVSILAFTATTGVILVVRAGTGVIAWQETAEIPLMAILMLMMVWHVIRRQRVLATLTEMGERERARAEQRERLSRMTSHELRTPATIATGYVELLLADEERPERRADLEVVLDELGRLGLATERLVRMLWIPQQDDMAQVDLDLLLTETADRWSVLHDRRWQVTSTAGRQYCSAARVRACVDTLIENAVRYTTDGDVVRLTSEVTEGEYVVGVADSGPGFSPRLAETINGMLGETSDRDLVPDAKSQTGLGLGLVREAVAARGGTVVVGTSAEGGASVLMRIPTGTRPRSLPPTGHGLAMLPVDTGSALLTRPSST